MNPDFWHQRWQDGKIGFHQERVSPMLEDHWDAIGLPADGRVFVPLAGKTLDMLWLAARGHRVLGIEISQLAVEQFFAENELSPAIHESKYGRHYSAGPVELICGDAFALDTEALADCTGVFDRAALIALPPELRLRYANELYHHLPPGCRGLVVTLEYPQHEKDGPPFSVVEDEVRALYGRDWTIEVLERRNIPPGHPRFEEGLSNLDTVAYRIVRS